MKSLTQNEQKKHLKFFLEFLNKLFFDPYLGETNDKYGYDFYMSVSDNDDFYISVRLKDNKQKDEMFKAIDSFPLFRMCSSFQKYSGDSDMSVMVFANLSDIINNKIEIENCIKSTNGLKKFKL